MASRDLKKRVAGPDLYEVHYEGLHCDLTIQRYSREVVILTISGTDLGEFGSVPFQKLEESLARADRVELFIDARDVRGASISVSSDWAQWLAPNRLRLGDIHMLVGSKLVQVTAGFVRRFAELEGMMKVHTDAAEFDRELASALGQR